MHRSAAATRQQVKMLPNLARHPFSLHPDQVGCPQDGQWIVQRLKRSEVVADHGQPAQIWLARVEYLLDQLDQGLVFGLLKLIEQFVRQVVWIAHPKIEGLEPRLASQDRYNVRAP